RRSVVIGSLLLQRVRRLPTPLAQYAAYATAVADARQGAPERRPSHQGSERLAGEILQLLVAPLADLARPLRVGQHGPADGDEVEVPAFHAPQQLVERIGARTLALEGCEEFAGEPDRADRD